MPTIKFTYALKRFFPEIKDVETTQLSVPKILHEVDTIHTGLMAYILDEQGQLRKHVNIYIDSEPIQDRKTLSDAVKMDSEVLIMQALSGG